MAHIPRTVVEILEKVSRQPGTLQDYEKLYILLKNLPSAELEAAVSAYNLLDIFVYMDLDNNELSELALNIATIIFSTFNLSEFVRSHETELHLAISSRNDALRDFIILRLAESLEGAPHSVADVPDRILVEIVKVASNHDIKKAAVAVKFLRIFALSSSDGLRKLLAMDSFRECLADSADVSLIIRFSENSPPELLTRILNVLSDVLRLPRSMPVDRATPLAQMTWLWLSRISNSPAPEAFKTDALKIFARIWTLARTPFYDLRQSALLLLEAIMTEPWGITLLMDQPGFIEYLLNRSTENSLATEGASLLPVKFAIINQACKTQEKWCGTCPQWREVDEETLARLRDYVRCGPWGSVRAEAAVAMEQG
ncbi:unnamed protein product [Dibothriocephalus latus]|uniref:26S proteasome non-ATPase regulatory subunit 5 n=1 Tax=Dibothriocephalus latus TaxID=60516 RepID=A0A3P7LH77_DIBLA|nr:unnamed protein product [Dibothriocephalus latus]